MVDTLYETISSYMFVMKKQGEMQPLGASNGNLCHGA